MAKAGLCRRIRANNRTKDSKRTIERALPATRKRYAHRLANEQRTFIQNDAQTDLQNEGSKRDAADG